MLVLPALAGLLAATPATTAEFPAPRLHTSELLRLLEALRAGDEQAVAAATLKIGDSSDAKAGKSNAIKLISIAQLTKDTKGCDLSSLKYFEQTASNVESYQVALKCSYYDSNSSLATFESTSLIISWNFGKFIVIDEGKAAAPPPLRKERGN
jgi:hypothetical protein